MFELHTLGWRDFQQLCLTITREILGQTVESYLDSHDGGRDGSFCGTWETQRREIFTGKFVIQCKFTSRQNYSLTLSDLADEFEKVERLVKSNRCDSYILISNAKISGTRAAEIQFSLEKRGVVHSCIFGSTWINQQIQEHTRLRMLVPRLYGLGDLSQILDERAYKQARVVLETMREDLGKVVLTRSYQDAVSSINDHGFVMLIGEPASGKTTIASLIALASVDAWGSGVLKLDEPSKVIEHWNTEEPSQLFWLDDVFGVTQYEKHLATSWNHAIPQIKAMIKSGVKVVMTSRDYIYNSARSDLKASTFPLMNEAQVVIDVHNLTDEEKQQILYNHLKLGKQPKKYLTAIKPFLLDLSANERFIPETARRISDPTFTKDLKIRRDDLDIFVTKQELLLVEVISSLDDNSKAALALIYLRGNRLDSPVVLNENENRYVERLSSTMGACLSALQSLDGSLVSFLNNLDAPHWQYKHPTIGDAFARLLTENPEYLGIYVHGSDTQTLTRQVTCGNMNIEKAIIVPELLWPDMARKLNEFSASKEYKTSFLSTWGANRSIQTFLTDRCSDKFIAYYLENNQNILEHISRPQMSLRYSTSVDVAKRIFDLGLMPEEYRAQFVDTVSEYTVQGLDTHSLKSSKIKSFFTESEFENLIENVSNKLIPRLGDIRVEIQSNWYSNETDAQEYMDEFEEIVSPLTDVFGSSSSIIEAIESEKELCREWVEENYSEPEEIPSRKLESTPESDVQAVRILRSIFDDIDA